jgi:hypothetical protein
MAIVNSILSWIMKQRITQIEHFMKNPVEVQEKWRKKLLETAADTEIGEKYAFSGIKTREQFSSCVPLMDYESLKPYIKKQMNGSQKVLWPTPVKWYAKSSGTTSDKSKYIPVSEESLEDCHFKGGKDLISIYCNNHPYTKVFDGKILSMGGSHQVNSIADHSYTGDLSAILIQNLPFWIQMFRTPEKSIALMDNWEEKIDKMAVSTMHEDVTNISGVPSWALVLLKRILELTNKKNILEVWPNFELLVHGGVSFLPYREQFKTLLPGSQVNYIETYNASEGFFGIQDRTNADDMLLMLDYGVYYEFIPLEEIEKENPETLTLEKVKTGVNYAIVISTNGGLWRYKIGDTITFTSLFPFRIKVSGRTKHFINAFGEEVIIDNAEKALDEACKATGAVISEYTASPVYLTSKSNGAHEWLIEFAREPEDMDQFIDILDKSLMAINSDYEAKRSTGMVLGRPIVESLPDGTFYRWLRSKGKLGGQNKVPRLCNSRQYADEIKTHFSRSQN